jgi:DNA/RNA non-specific endonuclease
LDFAPKTRKQAQPQAHPVSHPETAPASRPQLRPQSASALTPAFHRVAEKAKSKADAAPPEQDIAPGVIDLKAMDKFELPPETIAFLAKHKKPYVHARFGSLAEGPVQVGGYGKDRHIRAQRMPLVHPIFHRLAEFAPDLSPCLVVTAAHAQPLQGEVCFMGARDLKEMLHKAPELIGLVGFSFPKSLPFENKIEKGELHLGIQAAPIRLGSAFDGQISVGFIDDRLQEFKGVAHIQVHSLAKGDLQFERSPDAVITGRVSLDLKLPKNFSGKVDAAWDGRAVSGEGKLGYQGEKLSGSVLVHLMEKSQAEQLVKDKKSPPAEPAPEAPAAVAKAKPQHVNYVVFGEGDLGFAFNEWLSGTAHAIVDPEGFVTVIGEIRPQKELNLFEKHYKKQVGEPIEVRATWGLPVIADVYIGASGSLFIFADVKAVFQDMSVKGDYSTDPEKMKSFSLQGTFNMSAAAGLTLRLELFAGLEILKHRIEAGGGLNGDAGIHGYVLATPILGYREKQGNPGEDKKGEFFIKGSVEVAAQPFLGLGGDVFIRLRTPWWSPLSDRDWPWELGSKQWPIGGSIGFGADVEYVFGSGVPPDISFGSVDFSSDKLLGDLLDDSVSSGSGGKPSAPSPWHEKNQGATQVPPPQPPPSKPPKLPPAKKAPPRAARPLGAGKNADPNARTAGGKTVAQLKQEAADRGEKAEAAKKVVRGGPKSEPLKTEHRAAPSHSAAEHAPHSDEKAKAPHSGGEKWEQGVAAVKQALAHADRAGSNLEDLNKTLHSISARKEYGFKGLSAHAIDDEWRVSDASAPGKVIASIRKPFVEPPWAHEHRATSVGEEKHTLDFHLHNQVEELYIESTPMPLETYLSELEKQTGASAKHIAEVRKLAKKIKIAKDSPGGIGISRGQEIAGLMTEIADKLKLCFKVQLPPTHIEYKPHHVPDGSIAGGWVKAAPLSLKKPGNVNWTGSEPADESHFWQKVNQHTGIYIRGHLLNHHLFGPGRDFNMTPIHGGKLNTPMSSQVEEKIKARVLDENKVVSYKVQAVYGDWSPIYKNIPEENYLATGMKFSACEMKMTKPRASGDKVEDWSETGPAIGIPAFLPNERAQDTPPGKGARRVLKSVNLNLRSRDLPKAKRGDLIEAFQQVPYIGEIRAAQLAHEPLNFGKDWEALRASLALPDDAITEMKKMSPVVRLNPKVDPDTDLEWS